MKPDFSLSLSQDGIRLLQRTAAGWQSLGEVDPSKPALADNLAVLRQKASAVSYEKMRCRLVIPDEQVRFLTLSGTEIPHEARMKAACAALDGATPYAVSELVIDICAEGDVTHVAAVARETLAEAEAFASEHHFNPVSFAGHAQRDGFTSEPFFGMTKAAQDLLPPEEIIESERLRSAKPNGGDSINAEQTAPTWEGAAPAEPTFVSRRRVPTFRTEAPAKATFSAPRPDRVAGFNEGPAEFTPAPSTTKDKVRPAKPALPAPAPIVRKTQSEIERLTVFGDHATSDMSGRTGGLGIAILVCVALFAGIAAFAGRALGTNIVEFFSQITKPQPEALFTSPIAPQAVPVTLQQLAPPAEPRQDAPAVDLAALEPDLTDEDAAVLDALHIPEEVAAAPPPSPETVQDATVAYAVKGIWTQAPDVPSPPPLIDLEDLYVTSMDPINPKFDAVALPALASKGHDSRYLTPASPAPAGTRFVLDERGFVVPSVKGSLNADGIVVFAGPPSARPPGNLVKIEEPGEDLSERLRLAGFRPQLRPADLIETTERASFSGLTRSELGEIRPRLRPQSDQENARASASLVQLDGTGGRSLLENPNDDINDATVHAVVASLRPDARPGNFSNTVEKARAGAPVAPAPTSRVSAAPRMITPKIPSTASASREATTKNAIDLRKVNLIGVYGKPSSRRALVRLENGQFRKLKVGDRIDGGKVSAIGDAELRYQKRGRAIVLKMPRS